MRCNQHNLLVVEATDEHQSEFKFENKSPDKQEVSE